MATESTVDNEINIEHTVIVKEPEAEKYRIEGDLVFSVAIDPEKDELSTINGELISEVMINDTHLVSLDTWRYSLKDVQIVQIDFHSVTSKIRYVFQAKKFEVKA